MLAFVLNPPRGGKHRRSGRRAGRRLSRLSGNMGGGPMASVGLFGLNPTTRRRRKVRRSSRRRASAAQTAWRREFARRARSGGSRRRRRRVRRNDFPERRSLMYSRKTYRFKSKRAKNYGRVVHGRRYVAVGHRYAALRGRRGGKGIRLNPGLSYYAGRRRRRGRRSYRVRRNPFGIKAGGMLTNLKAVFSKDTLLDGAMLAGGAVGTKLLVAQVLKLAKKPEWNTGWQGYGINLIGAGLLGALVGMTGKQRLAKMLMLGGVSSVILQVVNEQVMPKIAPTLGISGMGGFGDPSGMIANRVSNYLNGMGDYLIPGQLTAGGNMGDFVQTGAPITAQAVGADSFQGVEETARF